MASGCDYDLIVIGCGPAGEKGAAQAAYFGKRVAVVEQARQPGGAAVHTGTLPSKTMRETALALSGYRQRELYGLKIELDRSTAAPRLLSRKDAVRGLEVARIRANLDRHEVDLYEGHAAFLDEHRIVVRADGAARELTAERVLVASGSVPFHPPEIDFDDPDIDDSDTILTIDRLPATLTIVGAGVIGCEYACMFAAMGVRVTLMEGRDRLLPFLDFEIAERLRESMIGLGIDLRMGDGYRAVVREKDQIAATTMSGAKVVSEKLLYAAGRNGATQGLGLERLGVVVNKRGHIEVDATFRTKVESIYAAGDVVGFPALASTSMEQARVAVCHAFGFTYKRVVSEVLPYGIYTIPEVSAVGIGEEDARVRGTPFVVGRGLYRDNARGKIVGDREGLVKLVFARDTRKLLGCHCLGSRASELVHIGQTAILLGGTVDTFIDMVFNYPTFSECFKYAAYDALGKLG